MNVVRGFNTTYVVHQLVADLFGDRVDRGYLYRVLSGTAKEVEVLILSGDPPTQESPLREWGEVLCVESREYDVKLAPGQTLDFELRFNATRVVTDAEGRKSRVDAWDAVFREDRETPRTPHDVYRDYLERRLGETATLLSANVVERCEQRAARRGRKAIRFVSTNLIGSLTVRDPAAFLGVIFDGIGRAKAFGQGLLCLSRPGTILPRRYGGDIPL
jgi:CRISPR system Cascade subunit CasE